MITRTWIRQPTFAVLGTAALALAAKEGISRKREVSLSGQVALITGGSRGLGLALARELAEEGCRIAICSRDRDELERAANDLRQHGAKVMTVVCDVGSEAEVTRLVQEVLAQFGRIDVLVTVAGIIEVGQFSDLELADFRDAMDVMFWGTLYPVLAVVPGMRERHAGRIAIVTSIGGKISVPHLLPYSAAKFAAVGLSEGLAAELAQDGITVSTIVPGLMRTGSHLNARFKGDETQRRGEYTWFSLGATMPLAARADRAARIIVRAIKRGERERIFTLPFALASRFHGVAPDLTIRLMQGANRILPGGENEPPTTASARGSEVAEAADSRLLDFATGLGREAATAFDQKPTSDASPPAS